MFVEYDTSTWILDSEVTNHICYSFQETSSWKKLVEDEITLKVRKKEVVSAKATRDLKLFFEDNFSISQVFGALDLVSRIQCVFHL